MSGLGCLIGVDLDDAPSLLVLVVAWAVVVVRRLGLLGLGESECSRAVPALPAQLPLVVVAPSLAEGRDAGSRPRPDWFDSSLAGLAGWLSPAPRRSYPAAGPGAGRPRLLPSESAAGPADRAGAQAHRAPPPTTAPAPPAPMVIVPSSGTVFLVVLRPSSAGQQSASRPWRPSSSPSLDEPVSRGWICWTFCFARGVESEVAIVANESAARSGLPPPPSSPESRSVRWGDDRRIRSRSSRRAGDR